MGMRVGMAVLMRLGMIMMMVVGVIMVVLMGVIMTLVAYGSSHPVVVVMDIPLMVIVVVNDQGARRTLLMGMMIVLMTMFMVVLMSVLMVMIVGVCMVMIIFMAGDPRLAASAYATHINLPRCR
ncbi:hypothetical protein ACK337_11565 [Aeromonas veronii]|uniref:hypothetical protein n=1 Tax=Aeromonas veronii TaxID=654 RepID=UPI002B47C649|nr:hypothetical protein [Aeromonas veronii]